MKCIKSHVKNNYENAGLYFEMREAICQGGYGFRQADCFVHGKIVFN
jgi:hypothetical protein